MKGLSCLLLFTLALSAQTITIKSPSPGATLTGYSGTTATVSLASLPNIASVQYTVDAYDLPYGAYQRTAPYSASLNSFWWFNGPHQIVATAYDALGNVLARSSPVPFSVLNTWPISAPPTLSVSTSTPTTSTWSGLVVVTVSYSGSGATDYESTALWVDGIWQYAYPTSSGFTYYVDTTHLSNGPHVIAITSQDQTTYSNYSCAGGTNNSPVQAAAEWTRTVNVSNTGSPMYLQMNAHEVFLQPGQTFQLSGQFVNGDGTTSTPAIDYYVSSGACTVSSTGLITGVAQQGPCQIRAMGELSGYTDLTAFGAPPTNAIQSSSFLFNYNTYGNAIKVTGGTGWTPGVYEINHIDLHAWIAYLNGYPMTTGTTGGRFTYGLVSNIFVFVNSGNTLPHWWSDGSISTSYNPTKSFFMNSSFLSLEYDQGYNPGYLQDYNASGFNTLETGISNQPSSVTDPNAFAAGQAAYVSSIESMLAPYPKLRLGLAGDSISRNSSDLYNWTQGAPATFNPPAITTLFKSWVGVTNPAVHIPMQDEVNSSWDHKPLQGPVMFNGGSQSGLSSIVASGGTCTANWTDWSLNGARTFMIRNASTAALNTTLGGNLYSASTVNGNQFKFTCPAVSNGTYDQTNNPNLVIEPYVATWCAFPCGGSGTGYVHYNAFSQIMQWANAAVGRPHVTWPNAFGTTAESVANWEGNGTQSLGGITQVAEYSDIYWAPNPNNYYLASRYSLHEIASQIGDVTRFKYGFFDPGKPINLELQGVTTNYSVPNITPIPISSCSGNTITFAGPHGITTVLPNITRVYASGTTACDGPYYVISAPSPTTLRVMMAQTKFSTGTAYSTTVNGGTIHWQNGDTDTLRTTGSVYASGTNYCNGFPNAGQACGNTIVLNNISSTLSRHRGQTFTISGATGAGSVNVNAATWMFTLDNPVIPSSYFPTNSYFQARQIPNISPSTGGAGYVIPDQNYIKGRNIGNGYDIQAEYGFANTIEAAIVRAAGFRMYGVGTNNNGYQENLGLVGTLTSVTSFVFSDSCNTSLQLFAHPHWENSQSVPTFWGTSTAMKLLQRLAKYILQPAQTTPDYGRNFETAVRSSSYGKVLMTLNLTDSPQTQTWNLAPYLQSGQQILKYSATYRGIAVSTLTAGTTSDTVTMDPGMAVFYVFPTTFAGELTQPKLQARLTDQPSATKIVVSYSYDRYWLDSSPVYTFDCGTGSCTLPVDPKIGTVYYRLRYLNTSGKILSTGDIERM